MDVPELADWEDKSAQSIYEILCDQLEHKPMNEHWEGYCARWITAKEILPLRTMLAQIAATARDSRDIVAVPKGPADERLEEGFRIVISKDLLQQMEELCKQQK